MDMITKLRNDANLRKLNYFKKRSSDRRMQNGGLDESGHLSESELNKMTKSIHKDQARERRKSLYVLMITMLLVAFMFYYLFNAIQPS